jgi:hypothetical protein
MNIDEKVRKTLTELGVADAAGMEALFGGALLCTVISTAP